MKVQLLILFLFAVIICGCESNSSQPPPVTLLPATEAWDSLPHLERIAKAYAKQHAIDFDFTGTHPEITTMEPWQTNTAVIIFYHGMYQPTLEVRIDRSGKVVETDMPTLIPTPTPN
jgi:hypothetical protein